MRHKDRKLPEFEIKFRYEGGSTIPYFREKLSLKGWKKVPCKKGEYYDPIEDYSEFKRILCVVEKMVDEEMGEFKKSFGACHQAWKIKKRILKEIYGIRWHSAADMNPDRDYD